MTREDYERYVGAFNARDYDAVFDFYIDDPDIAFFGVTLRSRDDLRRFYGFLHSYVRETVTVERFAGSADMAAIEATVRVEGLRDLTAEMLEQNGMAGLQPIRAGDVQEMRQWIHYPLRDGKLASVSCVLAP